VLNGYRKLSIDLIMEPGRTNRPSSGKNYYETVVIPYVEGISEKFVPIKYLFNVSTICKTNHTLSGTLMNTGPVRDPSRLGNMHGIYCDCSRCYTVKTGSRPLEVNTEECRYSLMQGLLEKSNLVQNA
jgi:hypothetical protein